MDKKENFKPIRFLWQQIASPTITDILTENKTFDGVVLDIEHGVFNPETMCACLTLGLSKGKDMFVRFPYLDKSMVRLALDTGATGVIFSTVETEQQAEDICTYCLYPSCGGKRGQGLVRENMWGEYKLNQREPIIVAQIETKQGILMLENIMNYSSFDYYLIGPYDLSSSIGCVGEFNNKKFKSLIRKFEEKVPARGRGYHIVKDIEKQYVNLSDCGFLAFSLDTLMLLEGTKNIEKIIHSGVKEK